MEAASLRLQEAAAKLLADVRGDCRTSQRAVNTLVSGMNAVTKLYNDVLKALRKELSAIDGYISIEFIFKVMDNFQDQSIFTGVETCQQFESYLREKSGGRKVKLKKATVEYTTVVRKGIPRIVPFKFGYVVSFLSQLEQFLNCPDVLQCVDNPLPTKSGVYRTVTDGLFYRFHPVVQKHGPTTLAVLMHVDDAEICDSLKSKAGKNSLRLFYWTLGNIHPEKRSSLKAINLLAIARAKVAKAYGNDFLLRSFIRDMIRLGTTGVDLNIAGQVRRVYAVLLFASCDNPAAANLGKFKETHSALRPCRVCMVKSSEMCEHFREDRALLRNLAEHEEHVRQVMRKEILEVGQQLAVSDSDEDSSMEIDDPDQDDESAGNVYLDHKVASVNYGVNGESILSKAPGFDVTKCLPQDIMHVLNEGVIEVVCRLIIKDLCLPPRPRAKPVMDLEMFNHCIGSLFDLGHLSVSKPTEIERGHLLGKKLKQSASQMIVLLRLLPFIIHNRLPQEKLDLVLKANSIVDSSMAFETSNADVSKLEDLIEDFGNLFKTLYPWIKTLKLHCLSHLGSQTKILGPLRQHACFRYEAMHSEFTQIFDVVLTMKNPAETAAKRHLAHRNADLMQGRNGGYLNENDGAFGVSDVCLGNLPEKHCLLEKFPHLTEESFVSKVNRLVYRGSDWHGGVIMLLNRESNLFGRISACYKTGNDVFFTYNYLETKHMSCYNAFEILKCTEEYHVISFDEMKHLFPMWRVSYKFRRFLRSFILAQPPANIY